MSNVEEALGSPGDATLPTMNSSGNQQSGEMQELIRFLEERFQGVQHGFQLMDDRMRALESHIMASQAVSLLSNRLRIHFARN